MCTLKKRENINAGVLLLLKLQAVKVTLLHECFSRFLNCAKGTKLRKASHIFEGSDNFPSLIRGTQPYITKGLLNAKANTA